MKRARGKTKNKAPRVSVVIPCYNLGVYLDEAVASVLAQSYKGYETIIVDDGSDDKFTLRKIADYEGHRGIKVVRTRNHGLPRARNTGIGEARGEYVCCLDADDKYAPGFLKETVALLEKDRAKKLGFVTTWVQYFGDASGIWRTRDYNPARLAAENAIHVASLFRKQCWKEVGGYATNLSGYQDWDFWISIVARGYAWACVHRPLFLYRKRKGSMVTISNRKRSALMRRIIDNHREFFATHLADILDEKDKITRRKSEMLEHRDRSLRRRSEPFKAVKDDFISLLRSRADRLKRLAMRRLGVGGKKKR